MVKAGTANANHVLSGKTFTSASGVGITGTMANKAAWTNTPTGSTKVSIPAGYHNGNGYVDTSTVYTNGYNKGVTDADGRANASSVNYKTGYNDGYNAGYSERSSDIVTGSQQCTTNYGAQELHVNFNKTYTAVPSVYCYTDSTYIGVGRMQVSTTGFIANLCSNSTPRTCTVYWVIIEP